MLNCVKALYPPEIVGNSGKCGQVVRFGGDSSILLHFCRHCLGISRVKTREEFVQSTLQTSKTLGEPGEEKGT